MANRICVGVVLIFTFIILNEGRISVPKAKGIEPMVIEIPSGELPLSLVRNKRQQPDHEFGNVSHIGVTARLTNDSHYVAVVHWSGYPSEVSSFVLSTFIIVHNFFVAYIRAHKINSRWIVWCNHRKLFMEVQASIYESNVPTMS